MSAVVDLAAFPLPLPDGWIAPLSVLRSDQQTLRMILASRPAPTVPVDRGQLEEWVRARQRRAEDLFLAVLVDDIPCGFVLATPVSDGPERQFEVGLAIEPHSRHRGLGRAALDGLTARLPEGAGLVARVRKDNGRARALFRAAGFEQAGEVSVVTVHDPGPVVLEILVRQHR